MSSGALENKDEKTDKADCPSFCFCKQKDRARKQKILYSICIYCTFFMIGWTRGLLGPSLPDIQNITDVDLELGSWIITTFFIGYLFGSISNGFLNGKVERNLLFGASLLLLSIAIVGTPWCFLYELMIVAHLLQGFTQGIVDSLGNSEIILIWRGNRKLYFLLECNYWTGSFLAPLIAAPFLMEIPDHGKANRINDTSSSLTEFLYNKSYLNISDSNLDIQIPSQFHTDYMTTYAPSPRRKESMIFIPYSITAVLMFANAVSFFALYYTFKNENKLNNTKATRQGTDPAAVVTKARVLPQKLKAVTLTIMSSLFLSYVGVSEAFVSYLTVFCVEYLGWSPSDGAMITSVTNICGIVAIVMSMCLKCLNTLVYAGMNSVVIFVSFIGIMLGSVFYNIPLMWISCCVQGYFRAMLFSLFFTWTNDYITPVTSRVASLFMIFSCIGASLNPVMLGYMMEEYGDIWLSYMFVFESFIVVVLYFMGIGLTRYILRQFGKTFEKSKTYETTISITQSFIRDENDT